MEQRQHRALLGYGAPNEAATAPRVLGTSCLQSGTDSTALRSRLDKKLAAMEERIEQALNTAPPGSDGTGIESEELYRLLGAYRGLSQAIIDVAESGAQLDWVALRESRF